MYDGASPFDAVISAYSGTKVPESIHSTGRHMLLRFYSDRIYAESGFEVNITSKYRFIST